MIITDKQKKDLEDLVALLGSIRGRHTELVTVLVPAETNIFPVVRQLEAERSTAENIKSKQTRTSVIAAIEPPKPLRVRIYRCDQVFVIEPLQEMLDVDEVYGLLVMDRKEATIGVLEGKQIKVIRHLTSNVPGKYKTGGQCLAPNTLIETKNGT